MLGILSAFASSCTWACGTANYSKLARTYRPYDVNFARALWTLPCFIVAAMLVNGGLSAFSVLNSTNMAWLTVSVLASYAIGDVLFLRSTVALGVPGALSIASGYPILTALIGQFFEGQDLRAIQWLGLAVAVAGIVAVIMNGPKGAPKDGEEVETHPALKKKSVGVALALGTALAWTANGYSISKGGHEISALVANSYRMAIALPIIATLSLLTDKSGIKLLNREANRRYGWVFIVESFFGASFFVYGLTHTSLVVGNTLSALAPVLSVPVSIALKLERFSWVRTLAVLTVVVGLSLLFR